jgi:cytochrome P450
LPAGLRPSSISTCASKLGNNLVYFLRHFLFCLSFTFQGKEIREKFNLYFADLYNDLDAALSPIGFFFPNLPLPSMRRRDNARKKLNELFDQIIKNRLANPNEEVFFFLCFLCC